jgi:hypothetical protein
MSALGNHRERPNPPENLSEKWISRYETTDKHEIYTDVRVVTLSKGAMDLC